MGDGTKRCGQCKEIKPLEAFVRNPRKDLLDASNKSDWTDPRNYRPRCSICEITNRTEPKKDRRERHKARDTRSRHAHRLGISIAEMEAHYGWDLDRLEADILAVAETRECPNCHEIIDPVLGLGAFHLDIREPGEFPYYGINTRITCNKCNIAKGPKSEMRMRIEEAERQYIVRTMNRCTWCLGVRGKSPCLGCRE